MLMMWVEDEEEKIITITAIPCRHKSLTGFLSFFTARYTNIIHIFAQLNEIFSNLRWKIYCMCAMSSGVAIIYCRKLQLTFFTLTHNPAAAQCAIAFFQYLFSYIIDRFPPFNFFFRNK